MNQEIIEELNIMEMKLLSLVQDLRSIRARLEQPHQSQRTPSFFDALKAEDVELQGSKFYQCPHN